MGCCMSRESSQSSPYPTPANNNTAAIAPDASSRNITAASPPHPASLSTPRESHHEHVRLPASTTTTQSKSSIAPNTPLKPLDPNRRCALPNSNVNSPQSPRHRHYVLTQPSNAPWTRKRLEVERKDFWESRTSGRKELWQALGYVVECLQAGQVEEARAVLEASEATCPNGEVWRGVFDRMGEWYKIPEWIVVEPEGLVPETSGVSRIDGADEEDLDGKSESEDEVEQMKMEKGKGKAVEVEEPKGPTVKVRCRMSSTGQDFIVKVGKAEKLSVLISRLKIGTGIPPDQKLKIAYLGRILHPDTPLHDQGWREGHVLNALVFGA